LAYDGSQEGHKALINCKEMALWGDAVTHLISVIPDVAVYPIGEGSFIDTGTQKIDKVFDEPGFLLSEVLWSKLRSRSQ